MTLTVPSAGQNRRPLPQHIDRLASAACERRIQMLELHILPDFSQYRIVSTIAVTRSEVSPSAFADHTRGDPNNRCRLLVCNTRPASDDERCGMDPKEIHQTHVRLNSVASCKNAVSNWRVKPKMLANSRSGLAAGEKNAHKLIVVHIACGIHSNENGKRETTITVNLEVDNKDKAYLKRPDIALVEDRSSWTSSFPCIH